MTFTRCLTIASLLLATAQVAAASPVDQEDAKARRIAQLRTDAFSALYDGRPADAARLLEQVRAEEPTPGVLWSLGVAWEQAGEFALAQERFRQTLEHADTAKVIKQLAQRRLDRLATRVIPEDELEVAEARIAKQVKRETEDAPTVEPASPGEPEPTMEELGERAVQEELEAEKRAIAAERTQLASERETIEVARTEAQGAADRFLADERARMAAELDEQLVEAQRQALAQQAAALAAQRSRLAAQMAAVVDTERRRAAQEQARALAAQERRIASEKEALVQSLQAELENQQQALASQRAELEAQSKAALDAKGLEAAKARDRALAEQEQALSEQMTAAIAEQQALMAKEKERLRAEAKQASSEELRQQAEAWEKKLAEREAALVQERRVAAEEHKQVLEQERAALEAERARLEKEASEAVASERQELATRQEALAAREHEVSEKLKLAMAEQQSALEAERLRLEDAKTQAVTAAERRAAERAAAEIAAQEKTLAAERETLRAEHADRMADYDRQLEAEKARIAAEQARVLAAERERLREAMKGELEAQLSAEKKRLRAEQRAKLDELDSILSAQQAQVAAQRSALADDDDAAGSTSTGYATTSSAGTTVASRASEPLDVDDFFDDRLHGRAKGTFGWAQVLVRDGDADARVSAGGGVTVSHDFLSSRYFSMGGQLGAAGWSDPKAGGAFGVVMDLGLDMKFRIPLSTPFAQLYVAVPFGMTVNHFTSDYKRGIAATGAPQPSGWGVGVHGGLMVGADYLFTEDFGVFAEAGPSVRWFQDRADYVLVDIFGVNAGMIAVF